MAGGLGFLAGLGQAAQGLPQGLQAAQTIAQQQEHAALLRAQLAQNQQQFDATRLVDVPTEMLPSASRAQAGTAPTVRQPTTMLPFLAAQGVEERRNEAATKQGAVLGNAFRAVGTPESARLADILESGAGNNKELIGSYENVQKLKRESEQKQQGNAFLGAILSGDQAKIQAALAGGNTPMAPPTAPAGPAPLAPPRFMPTGGMGQGPSPTPTSVAQQGMAIGAGASESLLPETRAPREAVGQAAQRVAQVAGIPPAAAPGAQAATPAASPSGFKMPPGMKMHVEPGTGKVTVEFGPEPNRSTGDALVKAVEEAQQLEREGKQATPRYAELKSQINTYVQPIIAPDLASVTSRFGNNQIVAPTPRGPMSETDRLAVGVHNNILAGIQQMKTFSPDEIKNYVGLLQKPSQDVRMTLQGLPGVGGAFGKPDQRYADFKALMGRLQGTAFGEGGKQLTPFEASVVFEYTPTGKEPGGSPQIMAKLKYLEAFTRMARDLRVELAKTGKAELDPNVMDQLLASGMQKAGLPIPKTPGAEALGGVPAQTMPSQQGAAPSAGKRAAIGPEGEGMLPADTDLSKFPGYRWK